MFVTAITTIDLTIAASKLDQVFPLPTSNQYQLVTDLKIVPTSKIIIDSGNNTDLLIFAGNIASISFGHQPIAIEKKLIASQIAQINNQSRLQSDSYINSNDKKIKELVDQWIMKSDVHTPNQILQILYLRTLEYLKYGSPIKGLHPYSQALKTRITDCGGFSTFLASLLQTQGIRSRIVVGYVYKRRSTFFLKEMLHLKKHFFDLSMHAWLEVLEVGGSWFPVDPSVEWRRKHGQSTRQGGFGKIPADRLVVSFGHNLKLNINTKRYRFPFLQHPEVVS